MNQARRHITLIASPRSDGILAKKLGTIGLAPIAVVATELIIGAQFWLMRSELAYTSEWAQQLSILYALLVAFSFILIATRSRALRLVLLCFCLLLVLVLGIPFHRAVGLGISLFLVVVLLGAVCESAATIIVPALVYMAASAVFANVRTVWTLHLGDTTGETVLGVLGLGGVITALLIERLVVYARKSNFWDQLSRLQTSVEELSAANVRYGTFMQFAERQAMLEERNRITREIHDGVGYTMTNIMMLAEDGLDKCPPEQMDLVEVLNAIRMQARMGLDDTRESLQLLRSADSSVPSGVPAIQHLVLIFSQATRIVVDLQLLAPARIIEQPSTFFLLFRFVQEGLTNSLRHGHARHIDIRFQEDSKWLFVTIVDNGVGSAHVQEGIGLQGMRERFQAVGGEFEYDGGDVVGFTLRARVPVEERLVDGEATTG